MVVDVGGRLLGGCHDDHEERKGGLERGMFVGVTH